jgi:hypothetical protein
VTLERPLVVAGEVVPVEYSERLILPDTVLTSTSFAAGRKAGVGAGRGSEGDLALGDSAADMPDALSAYDLRSVTATLGSDGRLAIRLATRTAPDRFGEFGDYVVTLDDVAWSTAGPTATRHGTLTISGGAVFWQKANPGGVETAALVHEGIDVVYEESALVVTMAASFLTSWTEANGDLVAHAYSQATLEGGARVRDHGGYVTLASPGFSRAAGSVPAAFGTGRHVLEVFIEEDGATEARADGLLALGLTAIRGFETALGRPLLEREHWPVHVFYGAPSTPTVASAATRVGAWVAGDGAALEGRSLDYLFVEQLARLVVADLLDRGTGAPFWIQEAFVQWLTASSLSTFYPTKDVHEFHMGRIDDYVCFVDDQAGCEDYFSGDIPLSQWNVSTLSATGSVKSLLLALRLDALLGAEAMGRVFGTFANGLPDAFTLKALLSGHAPDEAARDEILALWPHWIDGSGSSSADQAAIRALLDDVDADGLMVFEEARFGTSDSAHNGYFP